ncbi:hypothetical protein [Actinocrinis sp.]|uniref:MmyB family transcriptional regulator n=1 Tax=Actinocrinis sp. TaxID=1920516 RepID=UPI002D706304|nr:hypothetical protein [Actinocrinis sp.]HZP53522.1 hypothetical protein [Actinocrinis sp.]
MDRELLAHFLRARPEEVAPPDRPGDHVACVAHLLRHISERLADHPAVVFSRFGEVLSQTRPAIALFGDYTGLGGSSRYLVERWWTDPAARGRYLVQVGATEHGRLRRYRHAELGGLELYRQLLLDPVECQLLLVFAAVPGSPSDEKLRRLASAAG